MHFQQNISLKPYNTFGIDVPAEYFAILNNIDLLEEVTTLPYTKHILGGGSNILLTQPVNGLVIYNTLKGITVAKEDESHVWLSVASGEVWHDFVLYAIDKGWGGIENLALIPGTVGASPMQNIGAYGVEAKETIESVTFWNWQEKAFMTYSNKECAFGYRDSVFKHGLKEKVFIISVVYKLNKQPKFNTSYGAIGQELEYMGVQELSVKAIAQAVVNIRTSKLPDPQQIGNAGSFFKNPTVPKAQFDVLHASYPGMPSYPLNGEMVKVPAGWLIEQCGWKGYRLGETGVHAKQALVLVNYGNAKGSEVWALSQQILDSVKEKFGIELEREVQVW
ncbi:MAG: UDP-N-acetylenolpyruvoylglucosamine reductase [Flavipsychrobacter sp.]|jgi:UDP-N-acetylmuramate dehydrogenase|nr:UDP-N-acetylenolpyruvoylglucosamine reductase [Flavipsychrobacter sp.]